MALAFSNMLVFRYKGGTFNEIDHKNGDGRAVPSLKSEVAVVRPSEESKSHGGFSGRKWHVFTMFGREAIFALNFVPMGAQYTVNCARRTMARIGIG